MAWVNSKRAVPLKGGDWKKFKIYKNIIIGIRT
jgi:hypothetical protein